MRMRPGTLVCLACGLSLLAVTGWISEITTIPQPFCVPAVEAQVLDVNQASARELETLPGIGPVIASRIVTWREKHGELRCLADLREIQGIGPKKFERIRLQVSVQSPRANP